MNNCNGVDYSNSKSHFFQQELAQLFKSLYEKQKLEMNYHLFLLLPHFSSFFSQINYRKLVHVFSCKVAFFKIQKVEKIYIYINCHKVFINWRQQ